MTEIEAAEVILEGVITKSCDYCRGEGNKDDRRCSFCKGQGFFYNENYWEAAEVLKLPVRFNSMTGSWRKSTTARDIDENRSKAKSPNFGRIL